VRILKHGFGTRKAGGASRFTRSLPWQLESPVGQQSLRGSIGAKSLRGCDAELPVSNRSRLWSRVTDSFADVTVRLLRVMLGMPRHLMGRARAHCLWLPSDRRRSARSGGRGSRQSRIRNYPDDRQVDPSLWAAWSPMLEGKSTTGSLATARGRTPNGVEAAIRGTPEHTSIVLKSDSSKSLQSAQRDKGLSSV